MKRCPECGRNYNDDSMSFCLDDGSELLFGPVTVDEPATAILPEAHTTGEARTRTFDTGSGTQIENAFKRRSIIAGAVGIIVITALGIGSYLYYSRSQTGISSIAVMPFVNASGNAEMEYLSDGITESLINSLSQLSSLSVKARSSVFRYKGKDVDPQQIAADLKVRAVLNGRVVQRGESLVVSLDLVDAETGNQIWGQQYDRRAGDLTALQSEIARDVSNKLRVKFFGSEREKIDKKATANAEAYQLYLKGRYHWNKRTDEGYKKAVQFFDQAIELDPAFALAHVGLADTYFIAGFDDLTDEQSDARAQAAALRALEIDETLGEAHTTLASLKHWREWNWPEAEQEYKRAIELSPNYPTAHHWYAESLASQGRFEESFAEYNRALELDPFSLAIGTDLGIAYRHARQYDRAIEHLKKLEEMDPNFVRTHFYLGVTYESKGMIREAALEFEHGNRLSGENMEKFAKSKAEILDAFEKGGMAGYWRKIIELLKQDAAKGGKQPDPMEMAKAYSQLLERDQAFEQLETAFQKRDSELRWLKVWPEFDPIRDDPRFLDLMRRVGLSQ